MESTDALSKRKPEAEVHGADGLILAAVGIQAEVETDRADRKLVADAKTDRVSVVTGIRQVVVEHIAGIDERGDAQRARDGDGVLEVEDRIGIAAHRVAVALWAEVALGEAAHRPLR